jgi:alcohol dehydrogenase (NADP+)
MRINNSLESPPQIGLGTWKTHPERIYDAICYALNSGYQHFDCAPIYMNEKPIGQAIQDTLRKTTISRNQIWITSKLWNSFHAYDDAIAALKQTLHFMRLEYLDCFLIHWPVAMRKHVGHARAKYAKDFVSLNDIPLTETWQALIECQKMGLTRFIGVSNFSISKIQDIWEQTTVKPFINQVESHPLLTQERLLKYCTENNIHFTAYAPLGSSDRPSTIKKEDEPNLLNHPTIQKIAQSHNISNAQTLLAWAINRGTIVIPKSTQKQHIKDNLNIQHIQLSKEEQTIISALNQNYRFVDGRFFEKPNSPYSARKIWS